MSGYFYSGQSGSIGLKEDEQTVRGLIAERERQRREEEARRQAKKKAPTFWYARVNYCNGGDGHMINRGASAGGGTVLTAKRRRWISRS